MQIRTVDSGEIRPYHRNPRDHTDESLDSLKSSITKFGFRVPLVLDDEHTIVTGHGRFQAVQDLEGNLDQRVEQLRDVGRDQLADNLAMVNDGTVPVIFESELDGRTIDEYRISDNKVAGASEWDFNALENELEQALDVDGEVVGYDDETLAGLVESYEVPDPPDDDDDADPFDDTLGETETTPEDDEAEDDVVELICPECLETVHVDAELALREFEALRDEVPAGGVDE